MHLGSMDIGPALVIAGYVSGAWACARSVVVVRKGREASKKPRAERRNRDRTSAYVARSIFWMLLAVLFIVLAINRQLGLENQLSGVMRDLAIEQGWYHDRQAYQLPALVVLAALCAVGLVMAIVWTRQLLPRQKFAFAGVGLLACYVAAVSSSYHGIDALVRTPILGARTGWLIEGAGIALVIACAWSNAGWIRRRA